MEQVSSKRRQLLRVIVAALPPEVVQVWRSLSRHKRLVLILASTAWVATLAAGLRNRLKAFLAVHRLHKPAMADPTFGESFEILYSRSRIDESWEDFMNGMGLPPESPIRDHIRQLFAKPQLAEQLQELFDVLSGGAEHLARADVERFSQGIRGNMRVLLQSKRIPLSDTSEEDSRWLAEHFEEVFPQTQPLDRAAFPSFAKLVLLRRVVRTVIESVGLERLQEKGVTQPLVVDVRVDLGGCQQPFRLHTIAPKSIPSISSGASLGSLTESEDEGDSFVSMRKRVRPVLSR